MQLSIIVAMGENRVIGIENRLPWHLPADLQHFKSVTLGKPILMGRKTFDSIGRPLPGRTNIVVTRDASFKPDGVTVVHSIEQAIQAAAEYDEVMIVGGASFYSQLLPQVSRVYLTLVHEQVDGDAHFPELDPTEWSTVTRIDHDPDEKNRYAYSFLTLERQPKKQPANPN